MSQIDDDYLSFAQAQLTYYSKLMKYGRVAWRLEQVATMMMLVQLLPSQPERMETHRIDWMKHYLYLNRVACKRVEGNPSAAELSSTQNQLLEFREKAATVVSMVIVGVLCRVRGGLSEVLFPESAACGFPAIVARTPLPLVNLLV